MEEKLQICPWCGEIPNVQKKGSIDRGTAKWRVIDSTLECHVFPNTPFYSSEKLAFEMWNNRVEDGNCK